MFEEAQLYSPVSAGEGGAVTVHLADDHPGAGDPVYRARRNEIAAAALAWSPGEPAPQIDYSDAENEVWRTVCRELAPKHERYAVREYREAVDRVAPAARPRAAARRGDGARRAAQPAGATSPPPGSSRCASSTGRSSSASSTRPSTCATRRSRSTRPSPT